LIDLPGDAALKPTHNSVSSVSADSVITSCDTITNYFTITSSCNKF